LALSKTVENRKASANALFRLIVTFFIAIFIVLNVLVILIFLFWVENEHHMVKNFMLQEKKCTSDA